MLAFEKLLLENKAWANEKRSKEPRFFDRSSQRQKPESLWIGCSDSPVPVEIMVNTEPNEIFVHRNMANQVIKTDFNSLSAVQYAVQELKVKHVIVCGHYNCGGIAAALDKQRANLAVVNKWLMHIKDVYRLHQKEIDKCDTRESKVNRLVECNVIEQTYTLAHTSVIQEAWKRERRPTLHGWVYGPETGAIRELITLTPDHRIESIYQTEDADS